MLTSCFICCLSSVRPRRLVDSLSTFVHVNGLLVRLLFSNLHTFCPIRLPSRVINKNNGQAASTCHHLSYLWDMTLEIHVTGWLGFQAISRRERSFTWTRTDSVFIAKYFLRCFTSAFGDLTGNSKARVISCWRVIDNAVHFRWRLIGRTPTSNHFDCMCVVYNETWLFVWESLTGRSSSSLYWTNFKVSDVVYDNNWTPHNSGYSPLKEEAISRGMMWAKRNSWAKHGLVFGRIYSKIGLRLSSRTIYNVMNVSFYPFSYMLDDVSLIVEFGWIIYCLELVSTDSQRLELARFLTCCLLLRRPSWIVSGLPARGLILNSKFAAS